MGILEEAFIELNKLGLVDNHCDFSVRWLSKSKRYFSMVRSSNREPSVDALTRLAANLKKRHEFYETNKLGELRSQSELIYPLVRKAWTAAYDAALIPPRSSNQHNS